jgi:hypothetical protein
MDTALSREGTDAVRMVVHVHWCQPRGDASCQLLIKRLQPRADRLQLFPFLWVALHAPAQCDLTQPPLGQPKSNRLLLDHPPGAKVTLVTSMGQDYSLWTLECQRSEGFGDARLARVPPTACVPPHAPDGQRRLIARTSPAVNSSANKRHHLGGSIVIRSVVHGKRLRFAWLMTATRTKTRDPLFSARG